MSTEKIETTNPEEVPKKKLDLCYFKVPVSITLDEDGDKVANFKEVEHKNLCFKIETVEVESSDDAIIEANKMAEKNKTTLKIAAITKADGETITRVILCDHGSVNVNTNI